MTAAAPSRLPGLVEAHTHLDKTLWGMAWHSNEVGPRLLDKIDNERALKKAARHRSRPAVGAPDRAVARRTARPISAAMSTSTPSTASAGIEGVMATRERYRDIIDIEIVAFPQSGLLAPSRHASS